MERLLDRPVRLIYRLRVLALGAAFAALCLNTACLEIYGKVPLLVGTPQSSPGPTGVTVTASGTNVTYTPDALQTVSPGETQSFTVTPATGSTLSQAVGGSCPVGSWTGSLYTTGTLSSSCSVTFTASTDTFSVTASGTNATFTPDSVQTVNYNGMQSFSVAALAGYTLSPAVGGTCAVGTWSGGIYTTGAVTADCSVSFSATLNTYTVTPSGTNVTISPNGAQTVNYGATQAFTVMASTGYALSSAVGGSCAAGSWSGSTYTTGSVTANCSVSFSATITTFSVTPSGSNVTVSPSVAQTVNYNSTQAFTVTASTGYTLSSIVGGTCAAGSWSGSTYTTGAVTANCSVTFSAAVSTFSVTPSGSNVTISPSAAQTVNYNATQAFTVTANAGYTTSTFVGGTCPVGTWSSGTYTTGSVTGSCVVSFSAAVNAPTANAQSVNVNYNTPTTITLTGTAYGNRSIASYTVVASPTHGSLSGSAPNLTYTPTTGYSGADSFTFKVNDGFLNSSVATVSVHVIPPGIYFYNDGTQPDANWSTTSNWWLDASHSTPAGRTPADGDAVYVVAGSPPPVGDAPNLNIAAFLGNSTSAVTQTIHVNAGGVLAMSGGFWYGTTDSSATVTFRGNTRDYGNVGGNATFYDTSMHGGTVEGDASFYDTSINYGTVEGNAAFNDISYPSMSSLIEGNAVFNSAVNHALTISGAASFGGTVNGLLLDQSGNPILHLVFRDTSIDNYGNFKGDVTFFDSSSLGYNYVYASSGSVVGPVVFNDSSSMWDGTSIQGDVIFNSSSYWAGGNISGDVIFNAALNQTLPLSGAMLWGPASINGSLTDQNGNPILHWVFNDSSLNIGLVPGDGAFYNSSNNQGTITGDASFHGQSSNDGTVGGNAVFYDLSAGGAVMGNAIYMSVSSQTITLSGSMNWGPVNGTVSDQNGNPILKWIFNDRSNNGGVTGSAIFNDSSSNYGTVNGDATFNNESYTEGTVTGTGTFNDSSTLCSGTIGTIVYGPGYSGPAGGCG